MSAVVYLRNATQRYGERPALIHDERQWSFIELDRAVERLARGLAAKLPPGERVCLFMANRAEYVLLQLALERAGLVRVPLNARYTGFEVANVLADCGARALFFDRSTAAQVETLDAPTLWRAAVDSEDAAGGPSWRALQALGAEAPAATEPAYDALASINYTSGTSGVPKGVMLSHRCWLSLYKNMLIDRDIQTTDRLAHIGPLTHASGAYCTPFLVRGATNVIVQGGKVDALLEAIGRHKVTSFSCVPTVLTRIVNHPEVDRFDLSSLRWIGYGAESIQINTLEKALQRFGPILTQNYGLTEAMMTCTRLTPEEHFRPGSGPMSERLRTGSIGRPYSFVEVAVRDADGRPVAPGEIGEITIRAEHLMLGYWQKPEETKKVLRDGWLASGDLARRDDEGFVYLMGRNKEMLISGGFNIYPQEVEACLSACPGVLESAVIGAPDPNFGEIAVAFVASEAGTALTAELCTAHCKPRLGIKTPKVWRFIEGLPRTPNGKIDKALLRRQHLESSGGVHG